jgi:hypothetical protein
VFNAYLTVAYWTTIILFFTLCACGSTWAILPALAATLILATMWHRYHHAER